MTNAIFRKVIECFRKIKYVPYPKDYFVSKPSVTLNVGYAIIRFLESRAESGKIAFKTQDNDPNVLANAVFIRSKNQISIHFRAPIRDQWHKLVDHVDVDIYLPLDEVDKICRLKNENIKT